MGDYRKELESMLVDFQIFTVVSKGKTLHSLFLPETSLINAKKRLNKLVETDDINIDDLQPVGKVYSHKVDNLEVVYDKVYPVNENGDVDILNAILVAGFIDMYKHLDNKEMLPNEEYLDKVLDTLVNYERYELCGKIKAEYEEVVGLYEESGIKRSPRVSQPPRTSEDAPKSFSKYITKERDFGKVFSSFYESLERRKLSTISKYIIDKAGILASAREEEGISTAGINNIIKLVNSLIYMTDPKLSYDIKCLADYLELLKDYRNNK